MAVAITPDGRLALTGGPERAARLWGLQADGGRHSAFAYVRPRAAGEAALAKAQLQAAFTEIESLIDQSAFAAAASGLWSLRQKPWYERDPAVLKRWRAVGRQGRRTGLLDVSPTATIAAVAGAVALTADGSLVVAAGREGSVQLWECPSGRRQRTLDGHSGEVWSIDLTPDGRLALTGGQDGIARLWELPSGRCLRTLEGYPGEIASVAVTPDGRLALTGGLELQSDTDVARLWDVENGCCLRTLGGPDDMGELRSVALTPDGRLALTSGLEAAMLWDLASGQCLHTLERDRRIGLQNTDSIRTVAVVSDGCVALTIGGPAGTVRLWELPSGRLLRTLEGHAMTWALAATPDGRLALTGSPDGNARLWDLTSGRCLRTLEGSGEVWSVALTPDGRFALISGEDGTRLWELDWNYEF